MRSNDATVGYCALRYSAPATHTPREHSNTSWTRVRDQVLRAKQKETSSESQSEVSRQLGSWSDGLTPPTVMRAVKTHIAMFERLAPALANDSSVRPWVARSDDGSIGCDWKFAKRRLSVTFDRNGRIEFFAESEAGDVEGDIHDDAEVKMVELATWLMSGLQLSESQTAATSRHG